MRNTFLWEQFLEGRSTISRTNEKETAIMNKFPHIISYVVLIHSEEKDEEETQPNTKQNKTKQNKNVTFQLGPLSLYVPECFSSHHANNNNNQNFVKLQRTHTYKPISSFLFIDALSIQRYFFGALARRFLYTMYAPAIMICTATTTARYMPILGAEEVTTGEGQRSVFEFISSGKNCQSLECQRG
jgi:hypothetical protein